MFVSQSLIDEILNKSHIEDSYARFEFVCQMIRSNFDFLLFEFFIEHDKITRYLCSYFIHELFFSFLVLRFVHENITEYFENVDIEREFN